ncbi:MAG TPA: sortase, partial [Clostridiales bacterium]|nr:sortase [Clostridiales bacterium]
LKELSEGDTVIFTDMEGIVSTYSIRRMETLNPDAVDAVQNSGNDLVLYTCTKGGKTRVTVFCDRAD